MFTNHVPDHCRIHYPIVRAGPNKPLKVCIVSQEWRAINTHWYGGRTIRCTREDFCMACDEDVPRRWQAYIGVRALEGSQVALAALTPCCCATLLAFKRKKEGLAGLRCVLQRIGRLKNSELTAIPYGYEQDFKEMPMAKLEECVRLVFRQKNA